MASPSDTTMIQLNWKWEQSPGRFAPYATETTGKEGEYISGWSDRSQLLERGELGAATQLGKGDAVWSPRGLSRAILSSSTANSKNE